MNVVVLQVFVSLALVTASILLFLHSMKQAEHEHSDRLSLIPMERERQVPAGKGARSGNPKAQANSKSASSRLSNAEATTAGKGATKCVGPKIEDAPGPTMEAVAAATTRPGGADPPAAVPLPETRVTPTHRSHSGSG